MSRPENIEKVVNALMRARGAKFQTSNRLPRSVTLNAGSRINAYDYPKAPQRPFESDYPGHPPVDALGNVIVDQEGRARVADKFVGRNQLGGEDTGLSPEEIEALVLAFTGQPVQRVSWKKWGKKSGETRYDPYYAQNNRPEFVISVRDDLTGRDYQRVVAHELGHVINHIAGRGESWTPESGESGRKHLIPADEGMQGELREIYKVFNGGKTPKESAYSGWEAPHELMADAIRLYIEDPNTMKTIAPVTAAKIREFVNNNSNLNKRIQFAQNSAGSDFSRIA